jgi:hypothetical protein
MIGGHHPPKFIGGSFPKPYSVPHGFRNAP